MRVYLCDFIHNDLPGSNVLSGNADFTVPLNVGSIGAYAKQVHGDALDVRLFKYPGAFLKALDSEPPALVGMSNYAWNTQIDLAIATYIKTHYPGIPVVMGGPSMWTEAEMVGGFLRRHRQIDSYVLFEGERVFSDIITHVAEHGPDLNAVGTDLANIYRLDGDELIYRPETKFPALDDMPSPYLNGMMDEFLAGGLIPMFETNRGCPFACTYCTWGIASLNKVRKFPHDRVKEEINYVADNFPDFTAWIVADANFGIHPRDVETAQEIKKAKERCPKLDVIVTWDSKNTVKRNQEIASILDRFVSGDERRATPANRAYMAVQHLSPHVLENIKRNNIKLGSLPEAVANFHTQGVDVTTDVIYGLPGERWQDAIDTLAQCFDAGFDFINVIRALMLPGSEMENNTTRDKFGMKSKYMVRRGSYGEYAAKHGPIRTMECDEVTASSDTLSEDEVLSLNVLQWLVFFLWNLGRAAPALKAIHKEADVNPAEVLCAILDADADRYPKVARHLAKLKDDLRSVTFESPEAMHEHFLKDENWDVLRSYVRVELRYNALAFLDGELHREFFAIMGEVAGRNGPNPVVAEVLDVLAEDFIDPGAVVAGDFPARKGFTVSPAAARYLSGRRDDTESDAREWNVVLDKTAEAADEARRILVKWDFDSDPVGAVERLVGPRPGLGSFVRRVEPAA